MLIQQESYTADMLQEKFPTLIVAPVLFEPPPEGYIDYLNSISTSAEKVRPESISGRILQSEGVAHQYGVTLKEIVAARYEELLLSQWGDTELTHQIRRADQFELNDLVRLPSVLGWAATAKRIRLFFQENGWPLFIGMHLSVNRYLYTAPILSFVGQQRYIAGDPRSSTFQRFTAHSHDLAVERGWAWYKTQHEKEIKAIKELASQHAEKSPRLVGDVLGIIARTDGEVSDVHGTRLGWKNMGVHGRYCIQSPSWCYVIKCTAALAGKVIALAYDESRKCGGPTLQLDHVWGTLSKRLEIEVHNKEEALRAEWGELRLHRDDTWLGYRAGIKNPTIQIKLLQRGQGQQRQVVVGKIVENQAQITLKSNVPTDWKMTTEDIIAYAFYVGMEQQKRTEGDD